MLFAMIDSVKEVTLCLIQIAALTWTGLKQSCFTNPFVWAILLLAVHTEPCVAVLSLTASAV